MDRQPAQPRKLPRVAVVFTGGTISTLTDPASGVAMPALDGAEILARTPGLSEIAAVDAIDLGRTPASHFGFADLFGIWRAVAAALADPSVAGAVVVQGTDTIEETSFFFDLLHDGPKPVAVTGAMRSADDPAFDGASNLRDAVTCAASPDLRDAGVVVVLAGSIEPADDVRKTHSSALDTFRSPNAGSLGRLEAGSVRLFRARGPRRHVAGRVAAEPILLIQAALGIGGEVVDALRALEPQGIVVEATGAGNTRPDLLEACGRAIGAGIPVALATRCCAGAVAARYGFPGGGAHWVAAGAMLAGHLAGPKARVALALGVGADLSREQLAALLADPLAAGPGSA